MTWRRLAPRLLLFAAIAGAVLWAALQRDRFDPAALDSWLVGFGFWAPLAFAVLFAAGTVAFVPGSVFTLTGGALFGTVWGAVLALFGATLGASIAFLVARYIAGDWVARKAAGRLKQLIAGVEADGWRFVAFIRLLPLFPFNLTNYALGLTRIALPSYVATSFVCMAPGTLIYTWLGHAGREALAGDASELGYGLATLGGLNLAGIVFLPWIYAWARRRTGAASAGLKPRAAWPWRRGRGRRRR